MPNEAYDSIVRMEDDYHTTDSPIEGVADAASYRRTIRLHANNTNPVSIDQVINRIFVMDQNETVYEYSATTGAYVRQFTPLAGVSGANKTIYGISVIGNSQLVQFGISVHIPSAPTQLAVIRVIIHPDTHAVTFRDITYEDDAPPLGSSTERYYRGFYSDLRNYSYTIRRRQDSRVYKTYMYIHADLSATTMLHDTEIELSEFGSNESSGLSRFGHEFYVIDNTAHLVRAFDIRATAYTPTWTVAQTTRADKNFSVSPGAIDLAHIDATNFLVLYRDRIEFNDPHNHGYSASIVQYQNGAGRSYTIGSTDRAWQIRGGGRYDVAGFGVGSTSTEGLTVGQGKGAYALIVSYGRTTGSYTLSRLEADANGTGLNTVAVHTGTSTNPQIFHRKVFGVAQMDNGNYLFGVTFYSKPTTTTTKYHVHFVEVENAQSTLYSTSESNIRRINIPAYAETGNPADSHQTSFSGMAIADGKIWFLSRPRYQHSGGTLGSLSLAAGSSGTIASTTVQTSAIDRAACIGGSTVDDKRLVALDITGFDQTAQFVQRFIDIDAGLATQGMAPTRLTQGALQDVSWDAFTNPIYVGSSNKGHCFAATNGILWSVYLFGLDGKGISTLSGFADGSIFGISDDRLYHVNLNSDGNIQVFRYSIDYRGTISTRVPVHTVIPRVTISDRTKFRFHHMATFAGNRFTILYSYDGTGYLSHDDGRNLNASYPSMPATLGMVAQHTVQAVFEAGRITNIADTGNNSTTYQPYPPSYSAGYRATQFGQCGEPSRVYGFNPELLEIWVIVGSGASRIAREIQKPPEWGILVHTIVQRLVSLLHRIEGTVQLRTRMEHGIKSFTGTKETFAHGIEENVIVSSEMRHGIRGLASRTIGLLHNIRSRLSRSVQLEHIIGNAVSKMHVLSHTIRGSAVDSSQMRHDIRSRTTGSSQMSHNIREALSKSYELEHSIKQLITKATTFVHNLGKLVSKEYQMSHIVRDEARKEPVLAHAIRSAVGRSIDMRHSVIQRVFREIVLRHNAIEYIQKAYRLNHTIIQGIQKSYRLSHDILSVDRVLKQYSLAHNIRGRALREISLRHNIRDDLRVSRILRHTIIEHYVEKLAALRHHVRGRTLAPRQMRHSIRAEVSPETIMRHNIRSLLVDSARMAHNIRSPVGMSRQMNHNIRALVRYFPRMSHNIRNAVGRTPVLKHFIRKRTDSSEALIHNIRSYTMIVHTFSHNIRSLLTRGIRMNHNIRSYFQDTTTMKHIINTFANRSWRFNHIFRGNVVRNISLVHRISTFLESIGYKLILNRRKFSGRSVGQ